MSLICDFKTNKLFTQSNLNSRAIQLNTKHSHFISFYFQVSAIIHTMLDYYQYEFREVTQGIVHHKDK